MHCATPKNNVIQVTIVFVC